MERVMVIRQHWSQIPSCSLQLLPLRDPTPASRAMRDKLIVAYQTGDRNCALGCYPTEQKYPLRVPGASRTAREGVFEVFSSDLSGQSLNWKSNE
jgi:hypothetical protein